MMGLVVLSLLFFGYLGWIGWCLLRGWWPNRDGYQLIQRYRPWGVTYGRRRR